MVSFQILSIIFIFLPIILLLPTKFKAWASFVFTLCIASITTTEAIQVMLFGTKYYELGLDEVFKIVVVIDYLSAFFIITINIVVVIASFYAIGYNKNQDNNGKLNLQYISFSMLHLSMMLVLMTQSFVPFLIFWEILAVSSFLLVLFDTKNKEVLRSAINYLVQMHVCMLFLLIAFFIIIGQTGDFSFYAFHHFFESNNNFYVFLLLFMGFGMKAGFVPLHTWLPKADPAAPDHIAAVMSGATIKVGIYGILRVLTYIKSEQYEIGMFLIIISLVTGIYGIINAIVQKDIKKSLAYSSIENIGIIGLGLGLGLVGLAVQNYSLTFLGLAGAILHIFNHAMFKSLLFLGSGNIFFQTSTTNMQLLGGILNKSKISGTIFLIGALSICGLPPFNGFVSEFLIYDAIISEFNKGNVSIDVLLLVSLFCISMIGGMAIFNFTRMFGIVFLGNNRSTKVAAIKEVSPLMYVPLIVVLVIILTVTIFSTSYISYISKVVLLFIPNYHTIPYMAISPQPQILMILLFMIALIIVITTIKYYISKNYATVYGPTWGCGYTGETTKMQYTASSFSESFQKISERLLLGSTKYKALEKMEIFPTSRPYSNSNEDILDDTFIEPPVNYIQKNLKKFSIFKSGNTQTYVWYAFLFLLILFVLTFIEIL